VNSNGIVLIVVGVWVLVQVFAGGALQRLKIVGSETITEAAAGVS
jgi:hypothetical protein